MDIFNLGGKALKDAMSQLNDRDLKDIIDHEALAYALYTVEERALPNMIDGLKPVQRFIINRCLLTARGNKEKFHKLASIAGGVANAGYHHGEGSAQDAGALMANTWNNNFALLDGQGNFGSRLVQKAGAARYVFCRVSDNFRAVYKDSEYAPAHEDLEHVPPKHYLPIIPTVLLNGVEGMATGFATKILPHSLDSVIDCTRKAIDGKLNEEPQVQYPLFRGDIVRYDGGVELRGKYRWASRTKLIIEEIPYKYDRASYVEKILDVLEDKNWISYDDACGKNGFQFHVTIRKEFPFDGISEEERHEMIMKHFGLVEKRPQYITVIDEQGKLRDDFGTASELIKHFVSVRKVFVQKRIDQKIIETMDDFNLAKAKVLFIKSVIDGEIVIQGKTRKALTDLLGKDPRFTGFEDRLVSMNIYHITSDEAKKLAAEAKKLKEEHEYWKKTTVSEQYHKDLDELVK